MNRYNRIFLKRMILEALEDEITQTYKNIDIEPEEKTETKFSSPSLQDLFPDESFDNTENTEDTFNDFDSTFNDYSVLLPGEDEDEEELTKLKTNTGEYPKSLMFPFPDEEDWDRKEFLVNRQTSSMEDLTDFEDDFSRAAKEDIDDEEETSDDNGVDFDDYEEEYIPPEEINNSMKDFLASTDSDMSPEDYRADLLSRIDKLKQDLSLRESYQDKSSRLKNLIKLSIYENILRNL